MADLPYMDLPDDWREKHPYLILLGFGIFCVAIAVVRFSAGDYTAGLVVLWLVGNVSFIRGCHRWDVKQRVDLHPAITRLDAVLIMFLVVVAAGVLFYRLDDVPNMLWPDEGGFWQGSESIAEGKWQPKLFEPGTYTFPVLSNYFQGAIIAIGGDSLTSWRATSVVASLLAIPPIYLLGRHLVGRLLTVGAIVLLLGSPYFLAFSRIGYNNAQAIAPVAVSVYFFYAGIQRRSATLLAFSGTAAGLGFYTYPSARLALVLLIALLAAGFISGRLSRRLTIVSFGLVFVSALLVALPQQSYLRATDPDAIRYKLVEGLYFDRFYGESKFTRGELEETIPIWRLGVGRYGATELYFNPEVHVRMIGRGTLRTILAFDNPMMVGRHFITGSLGGVTGSVTLLLGLAAAIAAWRQTRAQIVLIWLLLATTLLSILSAFPPQWTRMVSMLPAMALLSSTGIALMVKPLERWIKPSGVVVAYGIAIAVIAVAGAREYFNEVNLKFPPAIQDVVALESGEEEKGVLFLGVYDKDVRLKEIPFRMREFGSNVEYKSVPLIDLPAVIRLHSAENRPAISLRFYFDQSAMEDALAILRGAYGAGEVRIYYDSEGHRIGGSFRVP